MLIRCFSYKDQTFQLLDFLKMKILGRNCRSSWLINLYQYKRIKYNDIHPHPCLLAGAPLPHRKGEGIGFGNSKYV